MSRTKPISPADYKDEMDKIRHWFATWQRHIRAVDYAAARRLFSTDVVAFGTHAHLLVGLDALQDQQWSNVWPRISHFQFELDGLTGCASRELAWAAVPWTSIGYHAGQSFRRPGRATVTFRCYESTWYGIHTHFSIAPHANSHSPDADADADADANAGHS
ncbi:MAG: nuclear transport factor 2 family protein [Hyphomicrobiaceae bacterium]